MCPIYICIAGDQSRILVKVEMHAAPRARAPVGLRCTCMRRPTLRGLCVTVSLPRRSAAAAAAAAPIGPSTFGRSPPDRAALVRSFSLPPLACKTGKARHPFSLQSSQQGTPSVDDDFGHSRTDSPRTVH